MGGVSMVLSDLVDVIGGGTPKTTEESYWNGSIPWLSVKDFCGDKKYVYNTEKSITVEGLNNSSTKLLHKDNIINSARGTVGELAMIPYDMAFNQSCFGLIPNGNNDPHFVYYLLKDNNITYKKEYTFKDLKGIRGGCLRFDFAILDHNGKVLKLIEYDGK